MLPVNRTYVLIRRCPMAPSLIDRPSGCGGSHNSPDRVDSPTSLDGLGAVVAVPRKMSHKGRKQAASLGVAAAEAGSVEKRKARPPGKATEPLVLDLAAVADVDGLVQEVTMLRAAIRRLVGKDGSANDVRVLAELRHQVEALCRALKTQKEL